MSKRIANINMTHQASLAGMEAGVHNSLDIKGNVDYNDHIIYSAMIQAGVERFRVAGGLPKKLRESNFLSHRIEECPFDEYHELMSSIGESLKYKAIHSDDKNLFTLTWFLTELIYSIQTKSSMVSVLPIPKISDYTDTLSPDALSAINGLFKSMENVELDVPVTRIQVPCKDVEIFHEIISSDLFENYVDSQRLIEDASEDKESIARNVMAKGKSLYNKFTSTLDVKKTSLSLIPVTASLIDSVCGKLPGVLADTLGSALSDTVNDKRRITIYNYGNTHLKLLMDYYGARSNNQVTTEKKP